MEMSRSLGRAIFHSGTTRNSLIIGGIVGTAYFTKVEDCVGAGTISSTKGGIIAGIAGSVHPGTIVNYCYFISGYGKYGYIEPGSELSESNTLSYDSTTFELNETVSIGNYTAKSLIEALNGYAEKYVIDGYSHWLLNKENNAVPFTINERTSPIKMDYQIILPNLASEGNMTFDGWYTDEKCTTPFEKTTVEEDISLYGKYEYIAKYESESSMASSFFPHITLFLLFLFPFFLF